MTSYSANDFHYGIKIILDREPYVIESNDFIKPGKGQAFVRVKMRRLFTGKLIEKTFKSTDTVEAANILNINVIYLYNDSNLWYFMNTKDFEQIVANKKVVGSSRKWLIAQTECMLTIWNNQPLIITPPNFVELKITDTDPGIKGDSVSTVNKPAILSTGAIVKVPLFIQIGDLIKVDTRSGEYVSRIKS
ncbi:MAG: elongation factor P [Candidatus Dasytiphilus stammeri]